MSSFLGLDAESGTQEQVHVIFHIGNAADPEVVHEDLGPVGAALVDFETRDLDDLFRFVRKKCATETKENESADFVGCFLTWGYSY